MAVKKIRRKISSKKGVITRKKVRNYSKSPLFLKKAKTMEALLKAHGLPNELVNA